MKRAIIDPRDSLIACIAPSGPEFTFLSRCEPDRCQLLMTEHMYVLLKRSLEEPETAKYVGDDGVADFLNQLREVAEDRPEPVDVPLRDFEAYFISFGLSEGVAFAVSTSLRGTGWEGNGVRILTAREALGEI